MLKVLSGLKSLSVKSIFSSVELIMENHLMLPTVKSLEKGTKVMIALSPIMFISRLSERISVLQIRRQLPSKKSMLKSGLLVEQFEKQSMLIKPIRSLFIFKNILFFLINHLCVSFI